MPYIKTLCLPFIIICWFTRLALYGILECVVFNLGCFSCSTGVETSIIICCRLYALWLAFLYGLFLARILYRMVYLSKVSTRKRPVYNAISSCIFGMRSLSSFIFICVPSHIRILNRNNCTFFKRYLNYTPNK